MMSKPGEMSLLESADSGGSSRRIAAMVSPAVSFLNAFAPVKSS